MKKVILFLFFVFSYSNYSLANKNCFIAKEDGKILKSEGDCYTRYTPQSSFKIALSLMGFDSGILKNENEPLLSKPSSYEAHINICKKDNNPRIWMRDSCHWYSRALTTKLGIEKFQEYVTKFAYGNMDLSDGIANSWIFNSLKISPEEQTIFLQKLVNRELPVSSSSYDKTKNIMYIQDIAGGWKLYGKTGNGYQLDKNGNKTNLQQGWFIGYIERDTRRIIFVSHFTDTTKQNIFASFRARNYALNQLWNIIDKLEE